MSNDTFNIKCTADAIDDLMRLLSTGPIIVTGIDRSIRNSEQSVTLHYTDTATEKDNKFVINIEKE